MTTRVFIQISYIVCFLSITLGCKETSNNTTLQSLPPKNKEYQLDSTIKKIADDIGRSNSIVKIEEKKLLTDKKMNNYVELRIKNIGQNTITNIVISDLEREQNFRINLKSQTSKNFNFYTNTQNEAGLANVNITKVRFEDGTFITPLIITTSKNHSSPLIQPVDRKNN